MKRLLALGVAVAILATACGDDGPDRAAVDLDARTGPREVEPGPEAAGLLAVISTAGDLVVMRPDGTARMVLAEASEDNMIGAPTWSPDGRRLAWPAREPGSFGDLRSTLTTANVDGSNAVRTITPFPAVYSSWDPTSSRIAFLGLDSTELKLGLAEVDDAEIRATVLDEAAAAATPSYFFSWDPLGVNLFAHTGTELRAVTTEGQVTPIQAQTGVFQAPVVSRDGSFILSTAVLENTDPRQALVLVDRSQQATPVGLFDGAMNMVMDDPGRKLAVQVIPRTDATEPAEAQPGVFPPGLSVVDLETGEQTVLSTTPKTAVYWSPSGDRLLSLVPEPGRGPEWFRWEIWSGTDTHRTAPFEISQQMLQASVRIFDQAAQSQSLWSPAGDSFVFAGTNESGDSGIWVVDTQGNATLVSDGVLAVWSPT